MLPALVLSAHNPGPYTGLRGNNTYLLTGAEPTLIDAGVGTRITCAQSRTR